MLGQETAVLLLLCVGLLLLMAAVTNGAGFSLDGIKGRTVGDGQHPHKTKTALVAAKLAAHARNTNNARTMPATEHAINALR